MSGLIAAAIAAHVPTLGLAQNTPDYQQNLVDADTRWATPCARSSRTCG